MLWCWRAVARGCSDQSQSSGSSWPSRTAGQQREQQHQHQVHVGMSRSLHQRLCTAVHATPLNPPLKSPATALALLTWQQALSSNCLQQLSEACTHVRLMDVPLPGLAGARTAAPAARLGISKVQS